MNIRLKALCAASLLIIPGSSFAADAYAVALGASFKQVAMTTKITSTHEGTVSIPAIVFNADGTSIHSTFLGDVVADVVLSGSTTPGDATYSDNHELTIVEDRNVLSSISVAAAAGKHAVASATANGKGASAANSGASGLSMAVLSAETTPKGAGNSFTSAVNASNQ